jgi:anaerobic magnesium-protoporphyrin IX monomethyl ester cyclase
MKTIASHTGQGTPRVLLLNPPGDRFYLRDYYCSSISKSGYYWHPIDLLVLSGRLAEAGFTLSVMDAIAEGLPSELSRQRIRMWRPDIIVFLSSASSWRIDRPFLQQVAAETGARMIGCGEIFLGEPNGLFRENRWLEAGIRDFTDPEILDSLRSGEPCPGLVVRTAFHDRDESRQAGSRGDRGNSTPAGNNSGTESGAPERGGRILKGQGPLSYGVPRHELFPMGKYRYPYHRHHPFASLLTAYGCPFHCRFCNSGSLGFRLRDMGNISQELEYIRTLGFRQLFIKDMSFGGHREHSLEFCRLLSTHGSAMNWNCYARLDSLDAPLLEAMSRAGCHLVQMGLETANPHVGRSMGKPLMQDKAEEVFRVCRRLGIRTGAHFVLGLPGETESGIRETVALARRLNPDYCSFNLFMPRHGSALGHLMGPEAFRGTEAPVLDPSETFPTRTFCELDPVHLSRWRGRAYRAFYLRPAYLLRQAFQWRTRTELAGILRDAWGLGRNLTRLALSSPDDGKGRT